MKWYDEGAARISFDVLPDDVYDSVVKRPRSNFDLRADLRHEAMDYWEVNPEYKQLMTRGTPSEWGRLFQQIPNDDLYWQKVYKPSVCTSLHEQHCHTMDEGSCLAGDPSHDAERCRK